MRGNCGGGYFKTGKITLVWSFLIELSETLAALSLALRFEHAHMLNQTVMVVEAMTPAAASLPWPHPNACIRLQDDMTEYKRRWEAREVALTFNQNGTVTYFTQVRARSGCTLGLVDPDLDPEWHSLLLHTGK